MRFSFVILLLTIFTLSSFGQSTNQFAIIDAKVSKIPDSLTASTSGIAKFINSNFKTETEKIRAIFYWTASNISYDVPNVNEPNFLDSSEQKIAKTLKSRKGICVHYAEVFNDIANKSGVKTYIITGYTKQNGKIMALSHAWCASRIDGKWFLFDPTWGSGYVANLKYYKKLNNSYFKVQPSIMIASHMPFDYLWEFLNVPWTNQEFYNGKKEESKSKMQFDYETEIDNYDKLSVGDKAFESAERIEKNGLLNNLIIEQYNSKRNEFTIHKQNKNIEKYNLVNSNYNEGISLLNDFIYYRNNKFKPTLPDDEMRKMIQNAKDKLQKCKEDIYNIGSIGADNSSNLNNLKRLILDAISQINTQEEFLNDYLSKSSLGRKMMFSKIEIR